MRAVVVGGGIGGLAVAVAVRRIDVEVEVHERAPEIREVGAGLSLWSNAVHALRRLGVVEQVLATATPFETAVTYDARGRVLSELSLRPFAAASGEHSGGAHRAELHRALAAALQPGLLRTGRTCVGVEEHPGGVAARFADGSVVRGDLVVGADGVHSAVRAGL